MKTVTVTDEVKKLVRLYHFTMMAYRGLWAMEEAAQKYEQPQDICDVISDATDKAKFELDKVAELYYALPEDVRRAAKRAIAAER